METASVLVIGNEVLTGKVEEANARFLVAALRREGVRLDRIAFVRDEVQAIAEEVRRMSALTTHVFTTGGVGGTHDDVTLPAVARAFDVPLERHAQLLGMLEAYFGDRITEAHRRMADLPSGSELLFGPESQVPVVRTRNVFVLPGAPKYLRIEFRVLRRHLSGSPIWLGELFARVPEEAIARTLTEAEAEDAEVEVGSYPCFEPELAHRVKVTVEGTDRTRVEAVFERLRGRIEEVLVDRTAPRQVGGPGLEAESPA